MALGFYIHGLVESPGEVVPRRLALVRAGVEHLLQLRSGNDVWGLPYAWKEFPPRTPMTITTAVAASGLLDVARKGDVEARPALYRAVDWLVQGIPWTPRDDGACPWFAEGWPILVNNVASMAGGFLTEAGVYLERGDCIERAADAARYVCGRQRKSGAWTYGLEDERSPRSTHVVDVIHMAYTLEGLLRIMRAHATLAPSVAARIAESVARGLVFLNRNLCGRRGLREKVWILTPAEYRGMQERAKGTRMWGQGMREGSAHVVLHPEEPRLWSLGALLTLDSLARCAGVGGVSDVAAVLDRVEALCTDAGRFRYRSDDDHLYVRHEAHVFAGLADFSEGAA
jgi:hypothetical protein